MFEKSHAKTNAKIVILFLYLSILMYLFTPFFTSQQISRLTYVVLITLIIYAIWESKFIFNNKFMLIFLFMSSLMVLNLLIVSYKYFVLVEMFTFLTIAFIPLFIMTSKNVDYEFLMRYWLRLSKLTTIMIPVYIYLYSKSYIGYADLGYLFHLNFIIQVYFLIIKKDINIVDIIFLVINALLGMILGSRGLFVASMAVALGVLLILPRNKGVKYYLLIIVLGVFGLIIIMNINPILHSIYDLLTGYGIKSRNLYLFIKQLEGAESEVILTGRKYVYETMKEYVKGRNGLPSGLGVTRYITNGEYYYSHNVLLDFLIVLGSFGTLLFTIWYIYKNIVLYKTKNIDYSMLSVYVIFSISFWVQSIMGDYFINSKFFWIMISILIANKKQARGYKAPYLVKVFNTVRIL